MCFCETNPPFCDGILNVSDYEQWSCDGKCRKKSVGSFWKTNPPERVLGVVSVRNAHAHSHYPAGLETTRGGLAPSQGARL